MSPVRRLLARYRAELDGDTAGRARVRRRLLEGEAHRGALLAAVRAEDASAAARVRRRVLAAPPRRIARAWLLAPVALAALALGLRVLAPTPLSGRLDADEPVAAPLTPLVSLAYQGTGEVGGTDRAPRIAWERGALRVDVAPDRGVDLTVRTQEAEVRVVGTVFSVTRDVLGTSVGVERGRVEVVCVDGARADLRAGAAVTCLPVRPAALLGRARALAPTDSAAALDAVDRGLAAAPAPGTPDASAPAAAPDAVVRAELVTLRVELLAAAGRVDEALAAADALLSEPSARRGEVARLAGKLALRARGCAAARPYIVAIPPEERVAADELARAFCAPDPAEAHAAIASAAALGADPSALAAARARLTP